MLGNKNPVSRTENLTSCKSQCLTPLKYCAKATEINQVYVIFGMILFSAKASSNEIFVLQRTSPPKHFSTQEISLHPQKWVGVQRACQHLDGCGVMMWGKRGLWKDEQTRILGVRFAKQFLQLVQYIIKFNTLPCPVLWHYSGY